LKGKPEIETFSTGTFFQVRLITELYGTSVIVTILLHHIVLTWVQISPLENGLYICLDVYQAPLLAPVLESDILIGILLFFKESHHFELGV
jgi:hypothetical protein